MASKKQIIANKNNSKKSTGPVSKLGKLKSSQNSIKHGLTSKQLIIGEDISQFENYRDRMTNELKPIGILQEEVVFKIIDTGYRLRRIGEVEAGIYNQEILHYEADDYKEVIASKIDFKDEDSNILKSSNHSVNLKGLAFARDANHGSAILKLNTIEDRLLNKYYKRKLKISKINSFQIFRKRWAPTNPEGPSILKILDMGLSA